MELHEKKEEKKKLRRRTEAAESRASNALRRLKGVGKMNKPRQSDGGESQEPVNSVELARDVVTYRTRCVCTLCEDTKF